MALATNKLTSQIKSRKKWQTCKEVPAQSSIENKNECHEKVGGQVIIPNGFMLFLNLKEMDNSDSTQKEEKWYIK